MEYVDQEEIDNPGHKDCRTIIKGLLKESDERREVIRSCRDFIKKMSIDPNDIEKKEEVEDLLEACEVSIKTFYTQE